MWVGGKILDPLNNQSSGVFHFQCQVPLSARPNNQSSEDRSPEAVFEYFSSEKRLGGGDPAHPLLNQHFARRGSGVVSVYIDGSSRRKSGDANEGALVAETFVEEHKEDQEQDDKAVQRRKVGTRFDSKDRFQPYL